LHVYMLPVRASGGLTPVKPPLGHRDSVGSMEPVRLGAAARPTWKRETRK